jgi:ABC-type transport system involved in multi-copper enzyme maturation permease subunit
MIWVAWRQHRIQLLAGAAAVAILSIALYFTGLGIYSSFRGSGLAHCLALRTQDCGDVASLFSERYSNLSFLVPLFLAIPALLGIFWGAPLVAREFDQGTNRFAWTQGVSRLRWAGSKIAVLGIATVVVTSVVAYVITWWSRPLVSADNTRFSLGIFDLRGFVPIAYALFALAVGVAAGTLIKRTIPAMFASLGVYAAVRVIVELWIRPLFAKTLIVTYPLSGPSPRMNMGDWIVSTKTIDGAGHVLANGADLSLGLINSICPGVVPKDGSLPDKLAFKQCIQHAGLRIQDTYQPGSRYMAFQTYEALLFLVFAAALIAGSIYLIRRRSG